MLMWEQPPGIVLSSSPTKHANQILANAWSTRETLATQSTEASKRLSDTVLDVVLYLERVESTACLLTLVDLCIGQIWAWMHVLKISIHLPLTPNTTTPSDLGSMPIIPGTSVCSNTHMNWFLMKQQISLWGLHRCSIFFTSCSPLLVYNTVYCAYLLSIQVSCPPSWSLLPQSWSLTSMVQLNPSGSATPAPPEGFMEYLMLLFQNSMLLLSLQLLSLPALQPSPLPTPSSVPPPPSQARSFSCPNHGTGAALVEKQKISKEITASAIKCKSLLDPDIEPISNIVDNNTRQTKHPRATKVHPHLPPNSLLMPTNPRLLVNVSRSWLRSQLMDLRIPHPLQTPLLILNHFQAWYILSSNYLYVH